MSRSVRMLTPLLWIRGVAFVRVAAVIGCLVHSAPLVATSIRVPVPDPWYSVSFEIEAKSLPPGVAFKSRDWTSGGFAGNFSNTTATPFYLVRMTSTPPNWVRELPDNIVPTSMTVSGAWFRMDEPGEWTRASGEGLPIGRFLKLPSGQSAAVTFEMDAYLGNRKITIGGRYVRQWTGPTPTLAVRVDRLELNSPLPAPLRVGGRGDPMIVNDGTVPLYAPLRVSQSGDSRVLPNPDYAGTVFAKPVGWITEVPFGFLAMRKLVAGKSYFSALQNPSLNRGVVLSTSDGWLETPSWDAEPMLTERNFAKFVPGFKFEQIYQDDRPADAKVPDPRPFEITAFYGTRKVAIRGRILYALNAKYDPRAGREPGAAESLEKGRALEGSDVAAAVRLYRRAARSGSGQVAARLAQIYCKGKGNVSRDYAEMLMWKAAAEEAGVDPGVRIERSDCLVRSADEDR